MNCQLHDPLLVQLVSHPMTNQLFCVGQVSGSQQLAGGFSYSVLKVLYEEPIGEKLWRESRVGYRRWSIDTEKEKNIMEYRVMKDD